MNNVRFRNLSSFLLALAVSFSCCGVQEEGSGPRKSLKGFEIYSWQAGGEWCYSLLPGTNRMKGIEEMTARETRLTGAIALKDRLRELAEGEFVSWHCEGIAGLAMPHDGVVEDIKAFCVDRGLKPLF